MKKVLAMLLAFVLVGISIAGCSSSKEPAGTPGEPTSTPTSSPEANKEEDVTKETEEPTQEATDDSDTEPLTLAMPGSSTERYQPNGADYGGIANTILFSRLLCLNPDAEPVIPDLAVSTPEISEDGTVYTFTIRDNAYWHDGTPVTAEDVKATFNFHARGYQTNATFLGAISKIKGYDDVAEGKANEMEGIKVDGNKITFELVSPVSTFQLTCGQMNILPNHIIKDKDPLTFHTDEYWAWPIGSGMYKFKEFVPNDYAMLEPWEKYHGAKPKIQNVRLIYTGSKDMLVLCQADEIDYFQTMSVETALEIDKLDNYTVTPTDIYYIRYFMWNSKGPRGDGNDPISDIRVRRAILHAIDREAICKELYQGYATVLNTKVPSSFNYANHDVYKYDYDPQKAKELCEEAGFDMNTPLKLACYYSDQQSQDICQTIVAYLNQAGFNFELVQITGDLVSGIYDTKDYNIVYAGLSSMAPEEAYSSLAGKMIRGTLFEKVSPSEENVIDPLFDRLQTCTDPDERIEILKELQAAEYEILYHMPLFAVQAMTVVNTARVDTADFIMSNEWFNFDRRIENWTTRKIK